MIEVKIDDAEVRSAMERLARAALNAAPLMGSIAQTMHTAVELNFMQQGRPKWIGYKYAPTKRRGAASSRLLQDTGHLRGSISMFSDAHTAIVGTNVKYAAIHQFGGKTGAHVILPKNKKALAFGGRVVKKVNHPGSKILARPFLALTEPDRQAILGLTQRYLQNAIK